MKKSDLKNFQIVEFGNGQNYMVNIDDGVFFRKDGWMPNSDYDDNLKLTDGDGDDDWDVVKVRECKNISDYQEKLWGYNPVVWTCKEMPKLSPFERAILENTKMKYVTRNEVGDICFFERRPLRDPDTGQWLDIGLRYVDIKSSAFGEIFSFIKWEDNNAWQVKELLESGVQE